MSEPTEIDGNIYNQTQWMIYLLKKDAVTGAIQTIDVVHHEIHEGEHFTVAVADADVDIAAPKYVRITTPNTTLRCHAVFMVSGSGGFLAELYENPTVSVAGSALTEQNNDRNSATTATATTFEDDTIGADGTLLFAHRSGSGTGVKIGGETNVRQEWILKQNEDYVIKVTPTADNTSIEIVLTWYEES